MCSLYWMGGATAQFREFEPLVARAWTGLADTAPPDDVIAHHFEAIHYWGDSMPERIAMYVEMHASHVIMSMTTDALLSHGPFLSDVAIVCFHDYGLNLPDSEMTRRTDVTACLPGVVERRVEETGSGDWKGPQGAYPIVGISPELSCRSCVQDALTSCVKARETVPGLAAILPERTAALLDAKDLEAYREFLSVAPDDVQGSDYVRRCHVYYHPSAQPCGSPTMIRAMEHGLAIVATLTEWSAYLLRDREDHGLLVAPGDTEMAAWGLTVLANNIIMRQHLGSSVQRRVHREFSAGAVAERLQAVYEGYREVRSGAFTT